MAEEREPLWASSLAPGRGRDYDEVFAEPEPVVAPRRPSRATGVERAVLGFGALVAILLVVVSLAGGSSLIIEEVPSGWGDIPMTCETVRFERGARAVEVFKCRSLDGPLPTGVYRSPSSQWTSDITRVDALASSIVIESERELSGWAAY